MAYRLKTVRYQNSDRRILLQNENGPCPLLAAANALLLQGLISLPSESIRLGVASIDDVVNVLAERALLQDHHSHHLDELLQLFPKLQYGMDVNPKFTKGPTGVEFTASLTAFDMLQVDLVHGWLLDPQDTHTVELIRNKTYNELIEVVVHGNEASSDLEKIQALIKEKERVLLQDDKTEEAETNDKLEAKTTVEPVDDKEQDTGKESDTNEKEGKVEDDWVNVANDTADSWVGTVNLRSQKGDIRIQTVDDVSKATLEDVQEEKKTDDSKAEDADETMNVDGEQEPKVSDSTTDGEPVQQETKDAADEPTASGEPPLSKEELKAKIEQELVDLKEKRDQLTTVATNGSLINTFLNATGHQLTHYGLHELYRYVQEESLCVFFRNNHFATLTKYKGVLYLLVTDLGYANVPDVMWEKLDGIDGDTEYANASFLTPAPQTDLAPAPGPSLSPEDVLAQRGQAEADFQLALQLSKHSDPTASMDDKESKLVAAATEASLRTYNGIDEEEEKTEEVAPSPATIAELPADGTIAAIPPPNGIIDGCSTQEDSDKLLAMQLQAQMENEDASLHLARKLQQEERERAAAARNNNNTTRQATSRRDAASSISSNCVIS